LKKLQVAQIGVGYWGPNLLRNLADSGRCEVNLVADSSIERRAWVKDHYPETHVTGSSVEVFNDPTIDAVVIATPVATHYEFTLDALNSGKHVLVEKPMATSVNEVRDIARIAKANKLVAMVGHTFLFNEAVRYVKTAIDQGELGELRYLYSQRVNLGRIRNDVDALWNLAPHDISIIQYWLNDSAPEQVFSFGMDYVQEGINDVVFLNMRYKNRVMANIHVSWLDPHKIRRMTVVGTKKMIVYDDLEENKIAIYDKGIDSLAILGERMDYDEPIALNFQHRSGDVILPKIDWKEPLNSQLDHFFDCIQNKTQCITGPDHALQVVEILSRA
jgi:predicted dehydrogenase